MTDYAREGTDLQLIMNGWARSWLWRIFGVFLGGLLSINLSAQTIANGHCFAGCPDLSESANHLIIRPAYSVYYNPHTKSADWVAYSVSPNSVGIASSLSRQVKPDGFVDQTLAEGDFEEPSDFALSRYVPLVDFAGTPFWEDANYSTNFVPRSASLNQGAWYGLSWAIRNAVNRLGELYVVAGPIYRDEPTLLPLPTSKSHRVPDAFFKVVIDAKGNLSAFVLDQLTAVHVHHCDLESDLSKVEQLVGFRILPGLQAKSSESIASSLGCY